MLHSVAPSLKLQYGIVLVQNADFKANKWPKESYGSCWLIGLFFKHSSLLLRYRSTYSTVDTSSILEVERTNDRRMVANGQLAMVGGREKSKKVRERVGKEWLDRVSQMEWPYTV